MYRLQSVILLTFFLSYGFSNESKDYEIVTIVSSVPKAYTETVIVVDKIDQELLDKTQPKNLSSLFREILAIDTSSNGGLGQLSSVFTRGSNSNHTLVKINGIKINPSTAGGASIYNLDTDLISNIEIGYGPLSAIHGSSAIGGVVDISTKPIENQTQSAIGINVGPDNFEKKLLKLNYKLDYVGFLNLAASRTDTDGFPVLSNSTLDRGYKNNTLISNFQIDSDLAEFDVSSWLAEGTIEYLVFGTPVSQDYKNYATGIKIRDSIEDAFFYNLNLNKSKDLIQQNDLNFLGQIDVTNTERDFIEFMLSNFTFIENSNQFILGIDMENEDVDYASYGTKYREKIKTESFFTAMNLNLSKGSLTTSLRNSDHDRYGTNLSWNLELLREFNQNWRIGLSNSSSFRSPVSSELYGFECETTL